MLRTVHARIVKLMITNNYLPNRDGMCNGIAYMGMQAIVANDVDTFEARFKLISQMEQAQLEHKQPDLLPFLDGVKVAQDPRRFTHLNQTQTGCDSTSLLSITPECLIPLGGIKKIDDIAGIYDFHYLMRYVTSLRETLKSISFPIALMLSTADHVISIGYQPEHDRWVAIDPSMPCRYFEENLDLVIAIFRAARQDMADISYVALSTSIYVAGIYADSAKEKINAWKRQPAWQAMHDVAKSKLAILVDPLGGSWLDCAAKIGDDKTVQALLLHEGNPRLQVKTTLSTPLHVAASHGHLAVVNTLLATTMNPDIRNHAGATALSVASQKGFADVMLALIQQGAAINAEAESGYTPLFIAARSGQAEAVRVLLANGANAEKILPSGFNLLHTTVKDDEPTVLAELIKHGINLEKTDARGRNALYFAILDDRYSIASALISAGANVNSKNRMGFTPLYLAAEHGKVQMVKLLLSRDADFTIPFVCSEASLREFAAAADVTPSMDALIKQKKSNTNKLSLTPSDIATVMGHEEVVKAIEAEAKRRLKRAKMVGTFGFFENTPPLILPKVTPPSYNLQI